LLYLYLLFYSFSFYGKFSILIRSFSRGLFEPSGMNIFSMIFYDFVTKKPIEDVYCLFRFFSFIPLNTQLNGEYIG
jgi:hypothetical protein